MPSELIAQQGKGLVTDAWVVGLKAHYRCVLHVDCWPEEEPTEDFLAALHE